MRNGETKAGPEQGDVESRDASVAGSPSPTPPQAGAGGLRSVLVALYSAARTLWQRVRDPSPLIAMTREWIYGDDGADAGLSGDHPHRELARRRLGQDAWRYLMTPRMLHACITDATTTTEEYTRALHVIERRTVVARTVAAHGCRRRDERLLPDPSAVDPWSVDPERIADETNVVTLCPSCAGDKRVVCPSCIGTARVRCTHCGGGGLVQGERGLKSCPECRGRGQVRCLGCSRGRIWCVQCEATGRVHACLDVVRQHRSEVIAIGEGVASALHDGVHHAPDFDRPTGWPHPLLDDTGQLVPEAHRLDRRLVPSTLDSFSDRLVTTRVQRFEVERHSFFYETTVGAGVIELAGRWQQNTAACDWSPLARRRWILAATGCLLIAGAVYAQHVYLNQHAWFAAHGSGGMLLAFSLVAALLLWLCVSTLALARQAWKSFPLLVPARLAGASILAALLTASLSRPTGQEARDALRVGNVSHARQTAIGLVDLGLEGASNVGGEVLDELHHQALLDTVSLPAQRRILDEKWLTATGRGRAEEHVIAQARMTIDRVVAGPCDLGLLDQLRDVVRGLDEQSEARLTTRHTLCRAEACADADDCGCAVESLSAAPQGEESEPETRRRVQDRFRRALAERETAATAAQTAEVRLGHLEPGALAETDPPLLVRTDPRRSRVRAAMRARSAAARCEGDPACGSPPSSLDRDSGSSVWTSIWVVERSGAGANRRR